MLVRNKFARPISVIYHQGNITISLCGNSGKPFEPVLDLAGLGIWNLERGIWNSRPPMHEARALKPFGHRSSLVLQFNDYNFWSCII